MVFAVLMAGETDTKTLTREDLWTLYKAAGDDHRFQVQLNWDRTKHYLVFNVAMLAAAGGLSNLGQSLFAAQFGLLVLVTLHSIFGAYSIWKGHTYYREARSHLKEVERQLGIIDTALAKKTTRGMARAHTGAKRGIGDLVTITNLMIVFQISIGIASTAALISLVR